MAPGTVEHIHLTARPRAPVEAVDCVGLSAAILEDGTIHVGDPVEVLP